MKVFSMVIPFRDTERERKFAARSIPSAIRVGPSELVLGIDEPADGSFVEYIEELCKKESFEDYKIVRVERSPEWNFQLAHVIWECYKACKHDKIFAFDIDSTLRPTILKGYDLIGKDKNAIVSFTKKLLIRNPSDLIRHVWYRFRVRRSSSVFSGNYWVYKPYYFEDVDLEGFQKIHNGIDTYLIECTIKNEIHNMVTLKDIGVDSMDLQNEDYPWNQFGAGIWTYANKKKLQEHRTSVLRTRGKSNTDWIIRIINAYPFLFVMLTTILYQHPWMIRGYMWARKNNTNEAVLAARKKTLAEWGLTGSQYIKNIHDWKEHGRLGTGYA